MALLPVILGGGEIGGVTPASIAAQRAVADALANKGTPKTLGEGIASLGDAIAYRAINARANKEQQAGQSSANADFQSLYGGGDGTATADPTQLSPVDAPPARQTQIGDFSASPLAAAPNAATPDLVDFTEGQEGFTPTAQPDGSQSSIGFGTKATPAEMAGQPISRADAAARLQQELGTADSYVSSLPGADKLNPNQREALDDAAYNLGSFQPGLTGAIASGDLADVPAHLAQYTGSWSPANQSGLQNRRNAEIALWNTPAGNGAAPAPVPAPGAPIDAEASLATADPNAGAPTLAPPQSGISPAVANVAQALQATGQPTAPSAGVTTVAQAMGRQGASAAPAVAAGPAAAMGNLPPSTGVATVASALAPRPAAPAAPGPAVPSIPPAQLQAAQRILSNPFATPQQQAQATAVLTQARQQADPEYQLKVQTEQAQLDRLRNPPASYGFQTLPDGSIVKTDPRTGTVTPAFSAPASANRPFTPDERKAFGIPDDQAGYMDAKGVPHYLGSSLSGTPSEDDATAIAKGIASGDIPPTSISKNSKYNAPVTAILAKQGTNVAQLTTDWNATQRFYSALDNNAQVRLRQNIGTLQGTLGTVRDLANQWNAGGYPLLNAATRQAALQGALGPDANKIAVLLGQQIADVTGEMGSVLMGGNSPTDHALDLASQNLSADWSYPTLTAALDQLDQNIAFRKNAILQSEPADAGNNPYFNAGGGTAGAPPTAGGAPPPAAPTAPGASAAPAATPTAASIAVPPGGTPVPQGGFADAGTPTKSFLDAGGSAAEWQFVPPEQRTDVWGAAQ